LDIYMDDVCARTYPTYGYLDRRYSSWSTRTILNDLNASLTAKQPDGFALINRCPCSRLILHTLWMIIGIKFHFRVSILFSCSIKFSIYSEDFNLEQFMYVIWNSELYSFLEWIVTLKREISFLRLISLSG